MASPRVLTLLIFCCVGWAHFRCGAQESRELLADPHFERGVAVLDPTPGKRVVSEALKPSPDGPAPVWEIAQWSSRFPKLQRMEFANRWSNMGKTIALSRAAADTGDITLDMRGSAEYGTGARPSTAPWVHLLAEQNLSPGTPVAGLEQLVLKIRYRVNRCVLNAAEQYDPRIHAAQFVLFLHVSNMDRTSPSFGKYLHFGVPLFDNRHAVPPAHIAPDTGGTGMYIYMPALSEYTDSTVESGQWVSIDKDILPLIRRGLQDAFAKKHFGDSNDSKAYQITFFTMGWELPGNFDVSMDVRDLSLRAIAGK